MNIPPRPRRPRRCPFAPRRAVVRAAAARPARSAVLTGNRAARCPILVEQALRESLAQQRADATNGSRVSGSRGKNTACVLAPCVSRGTSSSYLKRGARFVIAFVQVRSLSPPARARAAPRGATLLSPSSSSAPPRLNFTPRGRLSMAHVTAQYEGRGRSGHDARPATRASAARRYPRRWTHERARRVGGGRDPTPATTSRSGSSAAASVPPWATAPAPSARVVTRRRHARPRVDVRDPAAPAPVGEKLGETRRALPGDPTTARLPLASRGGARRRGGGARTRRRRPRCARRRRGPPRLRRPRDATRRTGREWYASARRAVAGKPSRLVAADGEPAGRKRPCTWDASAGETKKRGGAFAARVPIRGVIRYHPSSARAASRARLPLLVCAGRRGVGARRRGWCARAAWPPRPADSARGAVVGARERPLASAARRPARTR